MISVLATGGTIASRRTAPGAAVRVGLAGRHLVEQAGLAADVRVKDVLCKHSFALTLSDLLTLAASVLAELSSSAVRGVVVTHGTDTMEETAYLLDLLLPADATVVLTGAQRHAGEPDGDGPRNLADAVRVAASGEGLGAVVVMAGQIHAARQVRKAHTLAPTGFISADCGPVGAVDDRGVRVWSRPIRPGGFHLAELSAGLARVDIATLYLGADATQLKASSAAGARGIVLEALGAGNPTPQVLDAVTKLEADGIPVVVTSRCGSGPVVPIYGAGGGADLARAGATFAGRLGTAQARLLLAASLAAEADPDAAVGRFRSIAE
ncbi:L-asparaginase [Kribbella amoyensis]|uniref:asparaginase n=1 Tax=Kribbella amoyensis TaxID=996641 RepID=A0A561BV32_9ACTN|nr:asparaginase [Kribbella amoyensis]TWD82681.1 L-asparaginase [Kribbella amoyensis]